MQYKIIKGNIHDNGYKIQNIRTGKIITPEFVTMKEAIEILQKYQEQLNNIARYVREAKYLDPTLDKNTLYERAFEIYKFFDYKKLPLAENTQNTQKQIDVGGALDIGNYVDPSTPGYASGKFNTKGKLLFDIASFGVDIVNFVGPYIPEFGKFYNFLTDAIQGITNALFPPHTPLVLQLKAQGFDAFARDTYLLPFTDFPSKSSQDYYRWNDKFYQYYGNDGKPDMYGNDHGFMWWYPPSVLVMDPQKLINDQAILEGIHQKIGSRILDEIANPDKYPKEAGSGLGYLKIGQVSRGGAYTSQQQNYLNSLSSVQKNALRGATPDQIQNIIDKSNANLIAQKQQEIETAKEMQYLNSQSQQTQDYNAMLIANATKEKNELQRQSNFPRDLDEFFNAYDFRKLTIPIDDVYGHRKELSPDQIKALQVGTVSLKDGNPNNDTAILQLLHNQGATQVLQSEAIMPYYAITGNSGNYRPAYYFLANDKGG